MHAVTAAPILLPGVRRGWTMIRALSVVYGPRRKPFLSILTDVFGFFIFLRIDVHILKYVSRFKNRYT
jgi:hypothetical protein